MHRDLKAETTRPAAPSLPAQQRRFDAFRHAFNEQRPHEALGQRRPAVLYAPSDRLSVPRLRPITYPEHFEVRRVSTNGGIR
jgi:putative transposase